MADKCCIAVSEVSQISGMKVMSFWEFTIAMQGGDPLLFQRDATLFRWLKAAVLAGNDEVRLACIVSGT